MGANTTESKIREIEGDLFDAPDGTALIHACNCQGSWGKGIAEAFRIKYPAAYQVYRSYCKQHLDNPQHNAVAAGGVPGQSIRSLQFPEGSALIIRPQKRDYEKIGKRHWIICLFTSKKFGRNVSSPQVILANTVLAVADMVKKLHDIESKEDIPITALWSCRFNSGLFRVDWAQSRKVLEDEDLEVTVVRPPGE